MKSISKGEQPDKIWGVGDVKLKPLYFGALRLYYCLEALKGVRGKILEVGCGGGVFTRAVKNYRFDLDIVGSDLDPNLIKVAQKRDENNQYLAADVQHLPFPDKSFDAVLGFDIFEHLQNPKLAFTEVYQTLKRGGVFHTAVPLEGSFFTLHGIFSKLGLKPKEKYAGHIQRFYAGQIVKMLKEAGFSKIKWNFSGHLFYQAVDFAYFLFFSLLGKKTSYTVEGYIATSQGGFLKQILQVISNALASIFYFESVILKRVPGQIGHFTAIKT